MLCLQHSFSGLMGYIITADAVIKLFELGAAGPIRYQVGLMLCPPHPMCCQDCLCFLLVSATAGDACAGGLHA